MMTTIELLEEINSLSGESISDSRLLESMELLEKAQGKLHGILITAKMKKLMMDFGERDTDIYVVTYPKSGTTLTQMILYQMTTDGSMNFEHLYDVSPWCRHSAFSNVPMQSPDDPRIIKSHDEYSMLRSVGKGKFIFIMRDGLDVISSLQEHIRDYDNASVDFEELGSRKMKDWLRYNGEWAQNEAGLEVLYLHYEDLISDKRSVVARIAGFLGLELTADIIARVVERTSFEFMKEHETKFGEQPDRRKVYNNFIRKGKAGEGKTKLSPEKVNEYQELLNQQGPDSPARRYLA
jgi:hypothetical protein